MKHNRWLVLGVVLSWSGCMPELVPPTPSIEDGDAGDGSTPLGNIVSADQGSEPADSAVITSDIERLMSGPVDAGLEASSTDASTMDGSVLDVRDPAIDASTATVDGSDASRDGALGCIPGQDRCATGCVDPQTDPSNCGACGLRCRPVANGVAGCVAAVCVPSRCNDGFHRVANACVADAAPQLLSPSSLHSTTQRRPRLRWRLPEGATGARVELCRDRACTSVIETLRVDGTQAQPTLALAAGSVVFWRARATVGGTDDGGWSSPTWRFRVAMVDARGGVDASNGARFDVNGDGYDDLLVGEVRGRYPYTELGYANVYFGSASGLSLTANRTLTSTVSADLFAAKSANAGDLNGDGFADLAIAAPVGGRYEGSVSVYYGSPTGPATTASVVLRGTTVDQRFGSALAGIGDINGDGFAELAVYSPRWNSAALRWVGKVSVLMGSASGLSAAPQFEIEGTSEFGGFGEAVSAAGDVDADGYADVLIGSASRSAFLYYGSATGLLARPRVVLSGGLNFGRNLAEAGDVDGDGYADVLVGYPAATPLGASNVFVFHGSAAGLATVARAALVTAAGVANTGIALSSAGDVDGDGFGDVIVGGAAAPITGNPADPRFGWAAVYRGSAGGVSASPARVFWGRQLSSFGFAVAGDADVNGDGFADIAVGAPADSLSGGNTPGSAQVFLGSATGVGATPTRVYWGATRGFGNSVAF